MTSNAAEKVLREVIRRWAPHSGLCCVRNPAGGIMVTAKSCVCDRLSKRARKAAGMWPEEKTRKR